MFGPKFSMWLRAVCGSSVVIMASQEQSTWLFLMGLGFMVSACFVALSIVMNEPA